jgi:hypothetical protein
MALTSDDATPDIFTYQPPTANALDVLMVFRQEFRLLYERIQREIPESRYRSITNTKLEEASMWLNKAIAFTVK